MPLITKMYIVYNPSDYCTYVHIVKLKNPNLIKIILQINMIVFREREIDYIYISFPKVILPGRRGECLLYYRFIKRKAKN